jgi:hypothetical protein
LLHAGDLWSGRGIEIGVVVASVGLPGLDRAVGLGTGGDSSSATA